MVIFRTTRPHVAVLANIPGTHFYRNTERFKDELLIKDDVLIVRFDAQLYFANVTFFKDTLEELILQKGEKLKTVIIDCESMNNLDSSGVHTLIEVIDDYSSKKIAIIFSGVKGPVRDAMEKGGIINKIGFESCFMSIQEAVDYHEEKKTNLEFEKFIKQTNR